MNEVVNRLLLAGDKFIPKMDNQDLPGVNPELSFRISLLSLTRSEIYLPKQIR